MPFQYTGKVWCLRVPTGAFVAVRNGVAFPTGNSGFPKSLDVSKAIDRAAGKLCPEGQGFTVAGYSHKPDKLLHTAPSRGYVPPPPATDAARQWQGWGTALKPAHEPIVLARKPLVGGSTVAANVLAHGTGALNIDGCRVETTDDLNGGAYSGSLRQRDEYTSTDGEGAVPLSRLNRGAGEFVQPLGRWPANLILSVPEDQYALRDDVTPGQLRQLAEWMDANA